MKQVGAHEFEQGEGTVWTCQHCNMKVAQGFFTKVEQRDCTYLRERTTDKD